MGDCARHVTPSFPVLSAALLGADAPRPGMYPLHAGPLFSPFRPLSCPCLPRYPDKDKGIHVFGA